MNAIKVSDIRRSCTPEEFALEMGIPYEDAKKVLAFAMDPHTPENSLAILKKTTLEDGVTIGPGNLVI